MTQIIKSAIEAVEERLSLGGQLNAARRTLEIHLDDKLVKIEEQIPRHILQNAQGIIFLSELSASYGYGARIGTGIIIGKLENKDIENKKCEWSGPISIYTGSINYGLQYGASKIEHIIILKNSDLVANFMEKGSIQIGVDASFAVGPLGRDAQIGVNFNFDHLSPILSYSVDTKGLYIGLNLEGSIINVRNECNESFYNTSNISAKDVLSGKIKAPIDNDDYRRIVELLNEYCDQNNKEANVEMEDNNDNKEEHENQLGNLKNITKKKTGNIVNTLIGDLDFQLKDKFQELISEFQDKGQKVVNMIQSNPKVQANTENESDIKSQEKPEDQREKSNQDSKIKSKGQSKIKSKKNKTKNQQNNIPSQQNDKQNSANKETEIQENPKEIVEKIQERINQLQEISKHESPDEEKQKIAQAKLKLQQYMDQ